MAQFFRSRTKDKILEEAELLLDPGTKTNQDTSLGQISLGLGQIGRRVARMVVLITILHGSAKLKSRDLRELRRTE
jgi:hypothetical protein